MVHKITAVCTESAVLDVYLSSGSEATLLKRIPLEDNVASWHAMQDTMHFGRVRLVVRSRSDVQATVNIDIEWALS